jgi:hypothetical protein
MGSKHCRLYDENLVHNIIVSTGLSVYEYLKEHRNASSDDICEFLEVNSGCIIEETIDQINSADESSDQEDAEGKDDQWLDYEEQ